MSLSNVQASIAKVVLDFRKRAIKDGRDYAKIFYAFEQMVKDGGITKERAMSYFPDLYE